MADLSFNRFPEVAAAMHRALSQVVRKTAFDIQGNAQQGISVDTGFAKSSIYVVTADQSTYGEAIAPPRDAYLLPEVDKPTDDLTAYAAVGANYAVYLNYGTRFMAAQPFWEPAVDAVRPGFETALGALEGQIKL